MPRAANRLSAEITEEIANIGEDLPEWFLRGMARPREDLSIEIDGVSLRYFRWGARDKPAIILLHGFLAHRRCWSFIAPLLADKYQLLALDFSGMGDSGAAPNYGREARIKEIAHFIEAQHFTAKPFIAAHSYGGGLAIHFAAQFPDLVQGILACDTLMLPPDLAEEFLKSGNDRFARKQSSQKKIYPDEATIKSRFRLSPEQPCVHEFLFNYLAKHSMKRIDAGWTWKFDHRIMVRDEDEVLWWLENADCFAGLTLPKGIIYGEKSRLFGGVVKHYLREKSPIGFPIIEIPAAHHHIMLDQPLALTTAIDAIISTWASPLGRQDSG